MVKNEAVYIFSSRAPFERLLKIVQLSRSTNPSRGINPRDRFKIGMRVKSLMGFERALIVEVNRPELEH